MKGKPIPIWRGMARKGKFVPHDPRGIEAFLRNHEGKSLEVIVRKQRLTRSKKQSAWWWAVAVPVIAEAIGYDHDEHEMLHYALVAKCFGTKEVAGETVPNVRSSHLDVQEFGQLMEWGIRFAARELDCIVPEPSEYWASELEPDVAEKRKAS